MPHSQTVTAGDPTTQKVRQSIHQPGKHFYEHVTFPLEIQAAKWKVREQGDTTLTAYNRVDGSEILHQLIWQISSNIPIIYRVSVTFQVVGLGISEPPTVWVADIPSPTGWLAGVPLCFTAKRSFKLVIQINQRIFVYFPILDIYDIILWL